MKTIVHIHQQADYRYRQQDPIPAFPMVAIIAPNLGMRFVLTEVNFTMRGGKYRMLTAKLCNTGTVKQFSYVFISTNFLKNTVVISNKDDSFDAFPLTWGRNNYSQSVLTVLGIAALASSETQANFGRIRTKTMVSCSTHASVDCFVQQVAP